MLSKGKEGKSSAAEGSSALEGHEASEAQATGKMIGVFGDTKTKHFIFYIDLFIHHSQCVSIV